MFIPTHQSPAPVSRTGENIALIGALAAGAAIGALAVALCHRPLPPVTAPQPVRIVEVAADCGDAALPRGQAAAVMPVTNPSGAALLGAPAYSDDPKLRALQLKAETAENIARIKAASETYRARTRFLERIYTGR